MHQPREDFWVPPISLPLPQPISVPLLVTSTRLFSALFLSDVDFSKLHSVMPRNQCSSFFNKQACNNPCLLPQILTGMRQGANVQLNKNPFSQAECNSKTHSKLLSFLPSLSVWKVLKLYLPCDSCLNNKWHHVPCFSMFLFSHSYSYMC